MTTAKAVVLIDYVNSGIPGPEHFRIEDREVTALQNEGDILLEVHVMSADPYLRGVIKEGNPSSPGPGGVMKGFVVGKVIESRNASWPVGSLFAGSMPFQTRQVVTAAMIAKTLAWNLSEHITEDQISVGLSVLGMPGATAYGGLKDVLRPTKEGETLFVSAAAGAVGSMVGQLGKNVFGLETVGSCGGAAKCDLIKTKYGFDHAIDYKSVDGSKGLEKALKEAVPAGVDMYYENVGGIHTEAGFASLNPHGRIAICGMISQYNEGGPVTNNLPLASMVYKFQRIEGFMCAPWLTGQKGNFLQDMAKWWKAGKIKVEETHFEGVEQWPTAFQSLFTGKKIGKVVVKIQH